MMIKTTEDICLEIEGESEPSEAVCGVESFSIDGEKF